MISLKRILTSLFVFVFINSIPSVAFATEVSPTKPSSDMNAPLNGEIIVNEKNIQAPAPYISGDVGNVMAPIRAVVEQLGIEVTWNEADHSLRVGTNMHIFIGKDYYKIDDGGFVTFDPPPQISVGTTFVPLTFFQDILTGYLAYVQNGSVIK